MSLQRGIELFNQGRYWDAHEAWEEVWRLDRWGPDRGFYKGLIQVAAGCLHYGRRNHRGAHNKLAGGVGYLRPYLPAHHDVRLLELVSRVEELVAAIDGDGWPEGLEMPRIAGGEG